MRPYFLLIIFIIISCKPSIKMSDKSLVLDVLNNYIKEDSLYGGHISPNLLPYFYYPAQYSDDGHEIPPPPISHEGEHQDESKIAERVGISRYISKFDADHIKYQLIKSKDISSSFRGMRFSTNIQRKGKGDIDSGYVLY